MPTISILLLSLVTQFTWATLAFGSGPVDVEAGQFACTTQPRARWLDRAAITRKAVAAGYKVIVLLDVKGTCYHARALTIPNLQAEVYLDPFTGDIAAASIFDE